MPTTFKPVVYADNKRQDGTYNVKIRVTHRRQTLKLSTNMYVAAHQMTRALKLKDQSIIDEAKRIIDNWRAIVGRLGAAADVMTVRQVVDYIKQTEQNNMAFELDFIAYGRKKAETMRPGTGIGYQIALNALVRYIGTETLDISRINARFLTGFEQFIEAEPVLTHSRKGAIRQHQYAIHSVNIGESHGKRLIFRVGIQRIALYGIVIVPLSHLLYNTTVTGIEDINPSPFDERLFVDFFNKHLRPVRIVRGHTIARYRHNEINVTNRRDNALTLGNFN